MTWTNFEMSNNKGRGELPTLLNPDGSQTILIAVWFLILFFRGVKTYSSDYLEDEIQKRKAKKMAEEAENRVRFCIIIIPRTFHTVESYQLGTIFRR